MATTPTSKTIDMIDALSNPSRDTKVVIGSGSKIYVNLLSSLLALTTKDDVGLGNVDNTSDADKPLSTAQTQALAGKASQSDLEAVAQALLAKANQSDLDALLLAAQHFVTDTQLSLGLQGKANASHGHNIEDIQDLVDVLNGKASSSHQHPQSQIANLENDLNAIRTAIQQRAMSSHQHQPGDIVGLTEFVNQRIAENPGTGGGSVVSGANEW